MMARRAKAMKTVTFANTNGEDLDTLYDDLARDEDNLALDAENVGVISLASGRRINQRSWTPMPMSMIEIVSQVHMMARRAKAMKTVTFTNTNN